MSATVQATRRARSRARLRVSRPGAAWTAAPGVVAFAVFVFVPIGTFALYSFYTPGTFSAAPPLTLDAYRAALSSPLTRDLALNSLRVGVPVALATVALALPVAYWLRYSAGRLLIPVLFLITATIFASYLVRIYAWRTLLGENGIINAALERLGVVHEPLGFLLFSRFSVTVGLVHWLLPLAVLMLYGAFRPLEAGYLEAARDLGARGTAVWRRVILPSIAAPLATAFLLILIIASSDWVTPLLLGGGKSPMLGQYIQQTFKEQGNYPSGAALSLLMLVTFAVLYVAVAVPLRRRQLDRLRWVDAAPGAPRRSVPAGILTALVLLFLYVPLAVVVLFSLHSTPSLTLPFEGVSLRWYRQLFDDDVAMAALRASVEVATATAAVTLVLGTLTAYGVTRCGRRMRALLGGSFLLPLTLPPLFVGLALFTFFVQAGVQLSLVTVAIGHVVQTLPLFLLIARATLERLDPGLDEVAADLGASSLQAFVRVTLPQVWPALVAATALSFALSFDEFQVTVFLAGQQATLPLYVYGRLRQTIDPLINSISTLLMVVMFVLFAAAFFVNRLGDRRRRIPAGRP